MGENPPWLTQVFTEDESVIPRGPVEQLYVVNQGDAPATLKMRWNTLPEFPQVIVIPFLAVFIAALYLLGMVLEGLAPKISAVALSTFKTEVSQPIFLILLLFGLLFMLGSIFIPYFSLGEDIKMYLEAGLTVIRVLGIFLAIWAASKSISEEIEGRTALTVLSKPIGRVQFVIGKFLGISMAVALLILLLGLWFSIWTSFKPIYDTIETSERVFDWKICFAYVVANFPAIALIFMECVLFVSISVAISTRVGILPNFLICFAVYVLGHLTASLVASKQVGEIEQVVFIGQVISIIFPVLDHFDASTAIMTNTVVPLVYLGWAALYTLLYGTIMLLLSLVLFQDRDLA
jgi:ABC-type transport system involved in multi-copper enzyme maturation permease subunit